MSGLDRKDFELEVLGAEGLIFADFWSDGCEPCRALMPGVHELAEKYGDKIKFCSLNITSTRRIAIKQQVLGLPTMLIYKDGQKTDEINKDDANLENIEAMVQRHYN